MVAANGDDDGGGVVGIDVYIDDDDDDGMGPDDVHDTVDGDDDDDDKDLDHIVLGGRSLPNDGKCLDTVELYNIIRTPDRPDSQQLDAVQVGQKDVFFLLVKNTNYLERLAQGKVSQFPDDRGVWGSTGSSTITFLVREGQQFKVV